MRRDRYGWLLGRGLAAPWILLLVACSSTPTWTPFNDPENRHHPKPLREIDVIHYRIRLKLEPGKRSIEGSVDITFEALTERSSVIFHAADMEMRRVTLDGRTVPFDHRKDRLIIRSGMRPGVRSVARIEYAGRPTSGLHFVIPDEGYPDKPPMIWSQGETEYNHHWFPCADHPNDRAAWDLLVSAPSKYSVISNGRLVGREEQNGWATSHWAQETDQVPYLVSLVVAEVDSFSDRWRNVPVEYHVPKGRYAESDVRRCLGMTPQMLEFFSSRIETPYPYPKYAQTLVWDFIWGGMENVSATTLHPWAVQPARVAEDNSSEGLVAHELAHQWFGDLVTCRSWAHVWLNEGFATYFAWLWTEHRYGRDRMAAEMAAGARRYFEETEDYRRPTVCDVYTDPDDMFDDHSYPRGGWILHMLRDFLGEERWWKGIAHYVRKHARGVVETEDFRRAMEEASGEDLGWFFRQWLLSIGVPELVVAHSWADGRLRVAVEQKQTPTRVQFGPLATGTPEAFRFPVEIVVDGRVHRVWIDRRRQELAFECPKPRRVAFDPKGTILKTLEWKKSAEELAADLQEAPEALARTWAAERLDASHPALTAALKDSSAEVRTAAAKSLARAGRLDALLSALESESQAPVRRAMLEALGEHASKPEVLKLLLRRLLEEPTPGGQSAAAIALGEAKAVDELLAFFEKHRGDPHLAPGALEGLARTGDSRAVPHLLESAKYGRHPWLRRTGVKMLAKRWEKKRDEEAYACLLGLLEDPAFHIRSLAIEKLGEIGDGRAIPRLESARSKETDGRLRRSAGESIREIRKRK